MGICHIMVGRQYYCSRLSLQFVHSVQQKSSGLIFRTSRTGSHVTYSCHNSSRFTFPIFVHSWRFSVFHSLQSITPLYINQKTPIHSLNLKLKHELKVNNFPRRVAYNSASTNGCYERVVGCRSRQ